MVAEYEKTVLDELDLIREAANAITIRRHFDKSPLLYIPEVVWDYTRENIMVMERISGIPVADIATLKARQVDLRLLAERGVEIFFTQVFRYNFFHADMHPGNIFVNADDPADPSYLAVDFGIVGTLLESDQHYLAKNFHAFFSRDYRRVAELYVESGWVPKHTRVDEFEAAIRSVCEPIFEKPLHQISFGHLLLRLFQTARRFDMEVQPQLVLLQKTLLNIEGLGRQLYPDLDLWSTAKPFIERWMSEQMGLRAFKLSAERNLPKLWMALPDLPVRLLELLDVERERAERDAALREEIRSLQDHLRHESRRRREALVGIGLLVASAVLIQVEGLTHWFNLPWPSWLLGGAGLGLLVYSLRRSDGLLQGVKSMYRMRH